MDAYYSDDQVTLYLGDSRDILPTLADASVDAIVTDPPYELAFMGRSWDASGIAYNVDLWRECWRVLKPGGHLAAFGGTRTYHRMTVAIEDAGFEIRDSLHWIYGSGFPKGQDVAKSIDKRRDDRTETLHVTAWLAEQASAAGWNLARLNALFGFHARGMATHWITQGVAARVPTPEQWDQLRDAMGFNDEEVRPLVARLNARRGTLGEAWAQREIIGQRTTGIGTGQGSVAVIGDSENRDVTAAASGEARQWQGWNTALKPAHEPIVLARKSTGYNTTVANVLQHGTGALNIDGCRTAGGERPLRVPNRQDGNDVYGTRLHGSLAAGGTDQGRWPTNVLLSHPPLIDDHGQPVGDACADGCVVGCPVAEMDRQSGVSRSDGHRRGERHGAVYGGGKGPTGPDGVRGHEDSGGASRFFPAFRYEAKAPASERPRLADGTAHTTVKPLDLMRWLVRLVTPPGGTVLDPFAGSGTTLEACVIEGFHGIGIELGPEHAALCRARLSKPLATVLFGDLDTG